MCQLPKIIFTAIASADEKKLYLVCLQLTNKYVYLYHLIIKN